MGIKVTGTPYVDNIDDKKSKKIRKYVNALLIFFASYGAISYFLNAMSIEYYGVVVFPIIMIASYACASINGSKKKSSIGYLVVVGVFAFVVFAFSRFVNSGFNHILNKLYEAVDKRYILDINKQYKEWLSNSTLAVTFFFVAFGYALAILMNMIIAESMNIYCLLAVDFVVMFIPLYFGYDPDYLSMGMMIGVLLAVLVIKNADKYDVLCSEVSYKDKEKKKHKSRLKKIGYYKNLNEKEGYYKCRVMPYPLAIQTLLIICGTMAIGLIADIVTPDKLTSGLNNKVERSLKEDVKEFAMFGLDAIFRRDDQSVGGTMDGIISDGNVVRYDEKEDLRVEFTPIDETRVYLKGYVGTYYTGRAWVDGSERGGQILKYYDYLEENNVSRDEQNDIVSLTAMMLNARERLYKEGIVNDACDVMNMKITNTGLLIGNYYHPYYTMLPKADSIWIKKDINFGKGVSHGEIYEVNYYPYLHSSDIEIAQGIFSENELMTDDEQLRYYQRLESVYRNYVYNVYLDVPADKAVAISDFMDKYDIEPLYGENANEYYQKNGFDYAKQIEQVYNLSQIFEEDYVYTLLPGSTPDGREYVEYFLSENKKGYCVHFATSTVLLLRQMGIPARYVEGYVIDAHNWVDENNGVVTASVTDRCAHAWVEIYADGVGWIPVDTTPPSEDDEVAAPSNGFVNFIASVANTVAGAGEGISLMVEKIGVNTKSIIIIAILSVVSIITLWILSAEIKKIRRKKIIYGDDYNDAVMCAAEYAYRLLKFAGYDAKEIYTFNECALAAYEDGKIEDVDAKNILIPMWRLVYGKYDMTKEERDKVIMGLKELSRMIYFNLKKIKKIEFLIIKRMRVFK